MGKKSDSTKRKPNWSAEQASVILRAGAEGLSARATATTFKFPDRTEEDIVNKYNNIKKQIVAEQELVLAKQKAPAELCPDGEFVGNQARIIAHVV